ncbi:MAG: sulfatase [Acidobacteriota bacterium]
MRVAFVAAISTVVLAACRAPEPPASTGVTVLDLADELPAAERTGTLEATRATDGVLVSRSGALRFDLAAPGGAALAIELGPRSGAGALEVEVESDGAAARTALVRAFGAWGPSSSTVHVVPLGEPGAIRLSFLSVPASPGAAFSCVLVRPRIVAPVVPAFPVGARYEPGPRTGAGERRERPKGAIVYLMDALRARDLSGYGAMLPTSPHLDRQMRRGATLASNFSQAPNTPPSIKSLFTGRYLPATGHLPLPESEETMAEAFRRAGYRTAAFPNSPYVAASFGTDQGFDLVDASLYVPSSVVNAPSSPPKLYAERIASALAAWLATVRDEPFFAYVHAIHPHNPYRTAPPYDRFLAGPPRDRPYDGSTSSLFDIRRGKATLDADGAARYHRLLYDEDVAYDDLCIGKTVATLRSESLLDRTVLAFVADHGEEFLEHGGVLHGFTAYDEMLEVPLVLAGSGVPAGRIVPGLTETIDLPATLWDLCSVEPPAGVEGRSLLPVIAGTAPPRAEVFASASSAPGIFSLRTERWKYVWAPGRDTPPPPKAAPAPGGPRRQPPISMNRTRGPGMGEGIGRTADPRYLFDLEHDPREQENVVALHPIQAELMHRRLTSWLDAEGGSGLRGAPLDLRTISQEDCERLVGLGYIEAGRCPGDRAADP